jgi:hypothetical protein
MGHGKLSRLVTSLKYLNYKQKRPTASSAFFRSRIACNKLGHRLDSGRQSALMASCFIFVDDFLVSD